MGYRSGTAAPRTTTRPPGSRRSATATQDRGHFTVGPIIQNLFQQIDVRPGRQGVEEALADRRDPVNHTGRLEDLACERDRPRKIDERSAEFGPLAQKLREQTAPLSHPRRPRSARKPSPP